MAVKEAVETAINECIREHILEDFFRMRKDEVMKMIHLDYTWEKREKMIRKEEYEDGFKEGEAHGEARGEARGFKNGIAKVVANMLAQNMSKETILQMTGLTIEELQELCPVGDI